MRARGPFCRLLEFHRPSVAPSQLDPEWSGCVAVLWERRPLIREALQVDVRDKATSRHRGQRCCLVSAMNLLRHSYFCAGSAHFSMPSLRLAAHRARPLVAASFAVLLRKVRCLSPVLRGGRVWEQLRVYSTEPEVGVPAVTCPNENHLFLPRPGKVFSRSLAAKYHLPGPGKNECNESRSNGCVRRRF